MKTKIATSNEIILQELSGFGQIQEFRFFLCL
jgi:hypothetical protein